MEPPEPAATPSKRARYQKRRRQKLYAEIKNLRLTGQCAFCGVPGSTVNLQFDHIDPTTKRDTVRARAANGVGAFRREMAKCRLLCPVCHARRHQAPKENQESSCGPRAGHGMLVIQQE